MSTEVRILGGRVLRLSWQSHCNHICLKEPGRNQNRKGRLHRYQPPDLPQPSVPRLDLHFTRLARGSSPLSAATSRAVDTPPRTWSVMARQLWKCHAALLRGPSEFDMTCLGGRQRPLWGRQSSEETKLNIPGFVEETKTKQSCKGPCQALFLSHMGLFLKVDRLAWWISRLGGAISIFFLMFFRLGNIRCACSGRPSKRATNLFAPQASLPAMAPPPSAAAR